MVYVKEIAPVQSNDQNYRQKRKRRRGQWQHRVMRSCTFWRHFRFLRRTRIGCVRRIVRSWVRIRRDCCTCWERYVPATHARWISAWECRNYCVYHCTLNYWHAGVYRHKTSFGDVNVCGWVHIVSYRLCQHLLISEKFVVCTIHRKYNPAQGQKRKESLEPHMVEFNNIVCCSNRTEKYRKYRKRIFWWGENQAKRDELWI